MKCHHLLLCAATALGAVLAPAAEQPAPFGAVPSARQLRWQEDEFIGFAHFTVNTFTDKEWGYGDEDPKVFHPTAFDADQIARTFAEAGMKTLILTAKHHDGFCLWPSQFTEHSVKHSAWRDGKGDVVKEMAEACRRNGLRFGVYLSPWDRHHQDYGRPEYLTYFRKQLRELLTQYGPIGEVWFDGANGGDGYYGGARETRRIDNRTYYDWPRTWQMVRELQPDACMFSDGGPDVRWAGNEKGIAGDPCWATLNGGEFGPGYGPEGRYSERLNHGDRSGTNWIPAECDTSIRPGWFYHASEDGKVKSSQELVDLYFASVGRGASLLLNIPPNRRGQIHENDVKSLREFRRRLDATFALDLARNVKATATSTRANAPRFAAGNVNDGKRDTYWSTDDTVTTAELVLESASPITFSVVRLREYLPLGQRIDAVALDQWQDGQWREFATATSIGNCRLIRTQPVTTSKVRVRVLKAAASPALSEVGLFLEQP
jgi:alpha-L-fucosidase